MGNHLILETGAQRSLWSQIGVGMPYFTGMVIHDGGIHVPSTNSPVMPSVGIHFLRKLNGIEENYGDKWTLKFCDLLWSMKCERDKLILQGISAFLDSILQYFMWGV